MDRRSFLALSGSFMAWWMTPALPVGGTEVFKVQGIDKAALLKTIVWRPLERPTGLYRGHWVTTIGDYVLKPKHAPQWFHRDGPFGLYWPGFEPSDIPRGSLEDYRKGTVPGSPDFYMRETIDELVKHYDERVRI